MSTSIAGLTWGYSSYLDSRFLPNIDFRYDIGLRDRDGSLSAEHSNMTALLEPKLLTAAEYGRLKNDGRLTELVRGRIVEMNRPFTSYGYFLSRINALLFSFVEKHELGRVVGGDAGVVTQHDPDTIRTRCGDPMWRTTVISESRVDHCLMNTGQRVRSWLSRFAPTVTAGKMSW